MIKKDPLISTFIALCFLSYICKENTMRCEIKTGGAKPVPLAL